MIVDSFNCYSKNCSIGIKVHSSEEAETLMNELLACNSENFWPLIDALKLGIRTLVEHESKTD